MRENSDLKQARHKQRPKEPASQKSYNKKEDSQDDDSLKHSTNSDQYDYERFERRKTDHKSRRTEPNTADTSNLYVNGDSVRHKSEYDDDSYRRTNHEADGTTNFKNSSKKPTNKNTKTSELDLTDLSHLHASSQHEEYHLRNTSLENGLEKHRTTNRIYTSTPRFEREEEYEVNPNLGLSAMTFSYKSPPTRRKPKKKNPEETIW